MAQRGELFHNVKLKKPKTNAFDLSHQVLTTGNMGQLIPIMCQEVVPGDRFRVRSEIFCRMMPMLAPVMQRIDLYTHYFFVPNRLLWNISKQEDSWECFITGGKDGTKTPEPPTIQLTKDFVDYFARGFGDDKAYQRFFANGSLWDYLGLPTISQEKFAAIEASSNFGTTGITWNEDRVLAFPFLAYQLIYDEYYRDQNYTDPILDSENMTGGMLSPSRFLKVCQVRKRSWKKDYFTSALPWAQRGQNVTFPLGDSAPVSVDAFIPQGSVSVSSNRVQAQALLNSEADRQFNFVSLGSDSSVIYDSHIRLDNGSLGSNATIKGFNDANLELTLNGSADLSLASAITVNMLREGLRLQEWLERNAVGGARYVEQIYAHFGVMVPDATMQRPIYLGGGKQTIRISEVLQSVDTEEYDAETGESSGSPLGEMAGHGISVGRTQGFNGRQFLEHGFIIGIMSVMPKASYMNGMSRMWTRFDKLDYYFPEFAHLGEQEVKIKELNFRFDKGKTEDSSLPNRNDDTFGYQSRYAEYKYAEDKVSGEFRDSLKYWHLGREFDPMDQFDNNKSFLEVQPEETERIFAVNDSGATHKLLFQIFHDVQAIRPMPKFATPFI